jgi:ribosomal protein L37AE/L43A
MSDVERGLGGIWSCIYCEGTWLPGKQVAIGLKGALGQLRAASNTEPSSVPTELNIGLPCPACSSKSLCPMHRERNEAFVCSGCSGIFLKKGVLSQVAPGAASPELEAPIPGLVAALLAFPLWPEASFILLALDARERPRPNVP